jgi:HEAT repeat protein
MTLSSGDSFDSSREDCARILATLPTVPLADRPGLVERLVRHAGPEIRDRALEIGAAVFSDARLAELLREEEDAALRNAGSEILLLRGSRSLPTVLPLLADPEPDVVLQAVLILGRLRDPGALEALYGVLSHPDLNVVQEAILAIGRLGDGRSVPHLLPFLEGDPWVQMAALQALGDLRAPEGVAPLARKLRDPMMGPLAAEALARIGGAAAFEVLIGRDGAADSLDITRLELLAHVLEGLAGPVREPAGLRERLTGLLARGSGEERAAAARCLLCLGAGPWDAKALATLVELRPVPDVAPEALRRRPDLLGVLLRGSPVERSWGFLLAARFPEKVPAGDFLAALAEESRDPDRVSAELVAALGRVRIAGVAAAVLDLYLRLLPEAQTAFEPALLAHAAEVRVGLAQRQDLDEVERLILAAKLGEPAESLITRFLSLSPAESRHAAAALLHCEELIRRLPWQDWLCSSPDEVADLAAEAAGRYGLADLAGPLRGRLAMAPSPAVIRSLGELGDRGSVPQLLALLSARPVLRPVLLEALGHLGGESVREALRRAIAAGEDRLAYRALAACHEAADLPLFRAAATHADWFVRHIAADILAGSSDPQDRVLLAQLVADPVAAVAQKALALLAPVREEGQP